MLRKIGFGAGFWGIMFLAVSALIISPLPNIWQKILEIIIAGIAAYVLAMIYFKKTPEDLRGVVILWAIWMIISAILDLLITVQYVKAGDTYLYGLRSFYGMWSLWVSFVVALGAMVLAAKMNQGAAPTKPTTSPLSTQ